MNNNLLAVAEIDIIYRSKVKASERPQIKTSGDAYRIFLQHWDKDKIEYIEQFKVLFLNRANHVLGIYEVSTGNAHGTVVDPKQIFAAALKANTCGGIIACHNHPSGNLKPSRPDIETTQKLVQCGRLFDLPVTDHLIISKEEYLSFREEGLL